MAADVGPSNGKFGNMNVTPLIDVLLTLLVIFMVITPVTPMGERAQIPQPPPKHAPQQQNNRSVVLQVLAGPGGEPQVKINEQSTSMQDLESRLVDIYKTRAQKVLFIKADNGVPWADVATVIDDAHGAGVEHVGLITSKVETSSNRFASNNAS
jgi:biopolymer transport protein TolR